MVVDGEQKIPGGQDTAFIGNAKSRLVSEHLNHITRAIEGETNISKDIQVSFEILAKYYYGTRLYCIVSDSTGQPKIIYPEDIVGSTAPVSQVAVIAYIEPYLNIRSTLFLPAADAPWSLSGDFGEGQSTGTPGRPASLAMVEANNLQADEAISPGTAALSESRFSSTSANATAVLSQVQPPTPAALGVLQVQGAASGFSANTRRTLQHGRSTGSMPMSALMPMRSHLSSIGAVFVEDIGNLQGRDTVFCRQELDQFGSQLALMLERKSGIEGTRLKTEHGALAASSNAMYQSASYTLEQVHWLRTSYYGRLRAQRETSWFLGLVFSPDTYVIAYCMLTGQESLRERIGSMLWHHFYVIRALAVASGRRDVEIADLREEFNNLFASIGLATQLDNISLAFTVFSRVQHSAASGHFGPSRPFVIGSENIVSPYNDAVLTYASGRDLRYWEVFASLVGPHTYMLSYDTSKLDLTPGDSVQRKVATSLSQVAGVEELHRVLASLVTEGNLPRYYLAATLLPDAAAEELPVLDRVD